MFYSLFALVPNRRDLDWSPDLGYLRLAYNRISGWLTEDRSEHPDANLAFNVLTCAYYLLCDQDKELAYRLYGSTGVAFPYSVAEIVRSLALVDESRLLMPREIVDPGISSSSDPIVPLELEPIDSPDPAAVWLLPPPSPLKFVPPQDVEASPIWPIVRSLCEQCVSGSASNQSPALLVSEGPICPPSSPMSPFPSHISDSFSSPVSSTSSLPISSPSLPLPGSPADSSQRLLFSPSVQLQQDLSASVADSQPVVHSGPSSVLDQRPRNIIQSGDCNQPDSVVALSSSTTPPIGTPVTSPVLALLAVDTSTVKMESEPCSILGEASGSGAVDGGSSADGEDDDIAEIIVVIKPPPEVVTLLDDVDDDVEAEGVVSKKVVGYDIGLDDGRDGPADTVASDAESLDPEDVFGEQLQCNLDLVTLALDEVAPRAFVGGQFLNCTAAISSVLSPIGSNDGDALTVSPSSQLSDHDSSRSSLGSCGLSVNDSSASASSASSSTSEPPPPPPQPPQPASVQSIDVPHPSTSSPLSPSSRPLKSVADQQQPPELRSERPSRRIQLAATPAPYRRYEPYHLHLNRRIVSILSHETRRNTLKFLVRFNSVVEGWVYPGEMQEHPHLLREYLLRLKTSSRRRYLYLVSKYDFLHRLFDESSQSSIMPSSPSRKDRCEDKE